MSSYVFLAAGIWYGVTKGVSVGLNVMKFSNLSCFLMSEPLMLSMVNARLKGFRCVWMTMVCISRFLFGTKWDESIPHRLWNSDSDFGL